MSIKGRQISPPDDWQKFEQLCHYIWMDLLDDPNIQLHGRRGQEQNGVDVYGTNKKTGQFICIQCKGKNNYIGKQVTETELTSELEKAKGFKHGKPDVFILATTAPNDKNVQEFARKVDKDTNDVEVYVYGWEELCQRIYLSRNAIKTFYPELSNEREDISADIADIKEAITEIQLKDKVDRIEISDDVKKKLTSLSETLLDWPKELAVNGQWIDREEEDILFYRLKTQISSQTILLGSPGSGKSALLSRICRRLIDDGAYTLAIKADRLPNTVQDKKNLNSALGLEHDLEKLVKTVALTVKEPFYLIIDQLDALSELVDTKTNRLGVLHTLIQRFGRLPNVHILASSREFEFEYDLNLNSLNADTVILSLPEWEEIEGILKEQKLEIDFIDEEFKGFLRNPNNLNLYLLKSEKFPSKKLYRSDIDLYQDIWKTLLGDKEFGQKCSTFMATAAAKMADEALQELPLSSYEEHSDEIDWLCGSGFLIKNGNETTFSFRHQTMQSFAWIRSFLKEGGSLTDFVLEGQDNLNIRPKLRTALLYLRDVAENTYNQEIHSLLDENANRVRRHITYLILECIGYQEKPNNTEIHLLSGLLVQDKHVNKICASVAGSKGWFEVLKESHLAALMQKEDEQRWDVALLLASWLDVQQSEVIELVNKYWRDKAYLNEVYTVVRNIKSWEEDALELAGFLVSHPVLNYHVPASIASEVLKEKAERASEVVRIAFESKLDEIDEEVEREPLPVPDGANPVMAEIDHHKNRISKKYEKFLESDTAWYDLSTIANAAPKEFILNIWQVFENAVSKTLKEEPFRTSEYPDYFGIWFRFSEESDRDYRHYLVDALEAAIRGFASSSPDEFKDFIDSKKDTELLPCHRLFARGLTALADQDSLAGLSYLLEDVRRFRLGGKFDDEYLETALLIETICQRLTDEEILQLEKAIKVHDVYKVLDEDDAETRRRIYRRNRKARIILLGFIPFNRLSEETQKLLESERKSFAGEDLGRASMCMSGFVSSRSPMSPDQMSKAKVDDVLKCMEEFPDGKERHWTLDEDYVSSLELARASEKFAEDKPDKASDILEKITEANLDVAIHILKGVAKNSSLERLLQEVVKLEERGFSGHKFSTGVAEAIFSKLERPTGLAEEWCVKLMNGLEEPSKRDENKNEGSNDELEYKYEGIVFNRGGIKTLPHGNYPILRTFHYGTMLHENPLKELWQEKLSEHLAEGGDFGVWKAFCGFELWKGLRVCDHDKATQLLDKILETHPCLYETSELGLVLAHCARWMSADKYKSYLEEIKAIEKPFCQQLYGELLSYRFLLEKEEEFKSGVDSILDTTPNTPQLVGIARGIKLFWREAADREICTKYLLALIKLDVEELRKVIIGLVRRSKGLLADKYTADILKALVNHKYFEKSAGNRFMVRDLATLTVHMPDVMANVASQIIDSLEGDLSDFSKAGAGEAPDLIQVAITLHNLHSYRKVGLDLFERLLEFNAYKVRDALRKVDPHPEIKKRV